MQQSEDFLVGYARVSTDEQDLGAQVKSLRGAGIPIERIFKEHISGGAKRLPQRDKALKMASRPGGVLCVVRLDRLGRSMRDLVKIMDHMRDVGGAVRTLDGLNTKQKGVGRFTLMILAAAAEFERELASIRTQENMAARKLDGAKYGPKLKLTPQVVAAIKADLLRRGEDGRPVYNVEDVARLHSVSPSSINKHEQLSKIRTKMKVTRAGRPPRVRK